MCLCSVSLDGGLTAPAFQLLPTRGNVQPLAVEVMDGVARGRRLDNPTG
jgi:hypothetical protein